VHCVLPSAGRILVGDNQDRAIRHARTRVPASKQVLLRSCVALLCSMLSASMVDASGVSAVTAYASISHLFQSPAASL
jgi:hypothetical protein